MVFTELKDNQSSLSVNTELLTATMVALESVEQGPQSQQALNALLTAAQQEEGTVARDNHGFDRLRTFGLVEEDGSLNASIRAIAKKTLVSDGQTVRVNSPAQGFASKLTPRSAATLLEPVKVNDGISVGEGGVISR